MIQPFCKRCNSELFMLSVIILCKPDPANPDQTKKYHICNECNKSLIDWWEETNSHFAFGPNLIVIITPQKDSEVVKMSYAEASYMPSLEAWLKEPYTTLTTKYKELNPAKDYFKEGDMYRVFGSLLLERVPKDWPSDRPVAPNAKYYRPTEALVAA